MDGICRRCGDLGVQADELSGLCPECSDAEFVDMINAAATQEVQHTELEAKRIQARVELFSDVAARAEQDALKERKFRGPRVEIPEPPGD